MDLDLVREKAELVALCSLPGITTRRIRDMMTLYGSPAGAWEALRLGAASTPVGMQDSVQGSWQDIAIHTHPESELDAMRRASIHTVVRGESCYPRLLAQTSGAPWALFYRGALPDPTEPCVAVVGSRKASPYGREAARWLARALARNGVVVVSGAAYGVDHAAHIGALEADRHTIAVLGCGVDIAYPRSSASLLLRIAESGCVLSEYPPGVPPAKFRFPARNRIIAGVSLAVVVVEAAEDSGALLTADIALAESREVMAVPGQIFSATSRGTNSLLKSGATAATSPEDILSEIGIESLAQLEDQGRGQPLTLENRAGHRLLRALAGGISDPEELSIAAGLSAAETLSQLARFEVEGKIVRGPGGYYQVAAP
ncbi:MAG TPA: DNA-processing protein DprA [Candidatus Anoxymicrobiaceae bacterium]